MYNCIFIYKDSAINVPSICDGIDIPDEFREDNARVHGSVQCPHTREYNIVYEEMNSNDHEVWVGMRTNRTSVNFRETYIRLQSARMNEHSNSHVKLSFLLNTGNYMYTT